MLRRRLSTVVLTAALVPAALIPPALALASPAGAASATPAGSTARAAAAPAVLTVRSTSLGKIVVGHAGRTVYIYDVDHKGTHTSACTGPCRQAWPRVTFKGTASTKIKVAGVTGKVGSIAAGKGTRQVTLNGWPLYYYAGDAKAGQVKGQGLDGIWWVVRANGSHVDG
jgi:predicted lipoprotein with Yx(FWY)xxD motif